MAILICPKCGTYGQIDNDQLSGKVSVICPNEKCDFHETRDWRTENNRSYLRGRVE